MPIAVSYAVYPLLSSFYTTFIVIFYASKD